MSLWRRTDQKQKGGTAEAAGRVVTGTPPQDASAPGRGEVPQSPEHATDPTERDRTTDRPVAGAARPGAVSAERDYAPADTEPATGQRPAGDWNEADWAAEEAWQQRSRLVVSPIAAPSILGLMGFAGATFMVASNLAGWWGNAATTPLMLAPFAATFGGLAQLLAGMWAYRARDGIATAMHGTWGAFWLAYGLLALAMATGIAPAGAMATRAFGFWFIALCVVTLFGALGALRVSLALFTVLGLLAAGSGLLAAGLVGSLSGLVTAAGWVLVASATAAFYTAGAMLLQHAWDGRAVLPMGERSGADNAPTRKVSFPIQ